MPSNTTFNIVAGCKQAKFYNLSKLHSLYAVGIES